MKDTAKQSKETTTKKASKRASLLNDLQEKLTYFEEGWYRVGELEDRMREFTGCCSEILTRLTDQGLIISDLRKNSTMCVELADFNKKELDHLRESTLEFIMNVGNFEDKVNEQLEKKNEDTLEWGQTKEEFKQEIVDYVCGIKQNSLNSIKRCDDMIGELSKALSEQGSLLNQRFDRLYHELQALNDSYKLNHLNMKKIVDGLEKTVHDTGLCCKRRYDEIKDGIWHHMFVFRNEIEDIKKTRKLTEWLLVWGFTMALVAFACTVINVIKQMFY